MSDEKHKALRNKLIERQAVELHWLNGGEVEIYGGVKDNKHWLYDPEPEFNWHLHVYRKKPKLIEGWVNVYEKGVLGPIQNTKEEADAAPASPYRIRVIKVREVVE